MKKIMQDISNYIGATLFFVFALFLSACQSVPTPPHQLKKGEYGPVWTYLDERISREMNMYDIQGLSIALVDKNGILWTRGFGNADAENNVPAAPNTLYRIGSVSKPLTALVLLRLQEKGLLNIDDPLTKYLPEFSIHDRFGDHKPITLRTLLSHHSGLPSDRLAGMWVDNPVSLRKLTSQIDDESMASAPGTQYRYSNIGYSLVGRVIEVVTNKPYSKVVREELFDPLTMFSSSVSYGKEDLSGLASGYRSGKPCPILTLRDVPAGGVASTVEDMAKVLKILLNSGDEYLRYENIAEVTKPQYDGLPLDFGHKVGLDWNLTGLKLPGVKRIAWHNGAAYPHQAHMAFLPDDGIGVIILSNTMEASRFITDLGRDSLDLVLTAKRGGVPSLEDTSPEPPSLVNLDTNTMEQYAGYYNVLGQIARFKVVNNHMETELWNRTIEMHPISTSTFILRTKAVGVFRVPLNGLRIDFKTVEGYRVAVLTGITSPLVFTKIPEVRIPESWRERLGAYAVETKGESFEIQHLDLKDMDGVLIAEANVIDRSCGQGQTITKLPFVPVSEDEAVMWGLGIGEGSTLRSIDNGTLTYSGFVLKRSN